MSKWNKIFTCSRIMLVQMWITWKCMNLLQKGNNDECWCECKESGDCGSCEKG